MVDWSVGDCESAIEGLRRENHELRVRLLAFISRYDRDNLMRTADFHDPDCGCMRCERDRAATLLARMERM
jgi:hypothetical protein